jgi:hypothetical protein
MKTFWAWLTSPSRAIQIMQSEIEFLRAENKRLTDLLTQAWESSRIVPVQANHHQPVPADPSSSQLKTWGQQQEEFAAQKIARHERWKREETARLESIRQINEARIN